MRELNPSKESIEVSLFPFIVNLVRFLNEVKLSSYSMKFIPRSSSSSESNYDSPIVLVS